MSDRRVAAAKSADELPASAGNVQGNEGRFDASSKIERSASNSDVPEIGTATDMAGILAEMRAEFSGGEIDAKIVREYCDRLEAASNSGKSDKAEDEAAKSSGLANAVKAAMADAEAHGAKWTDANTEPANKIFHVDFKLTPEDRLKLGILAARCNETPERWLQIQLRARFDEIADKVFFGTTKRRSDLDRASSETYLALIDAVGAGFIGGRLAFRPSVMA